MRHATIEAVYRYWDQVRGRNRAPSRSDLDPLALARHLGDIFILERAKGPDGEAGTLRFRLAGSRVVNAFGREVTGAPFLSLFHETSHDVADYAVRATLDGDAPILIGARLVAAEGEEPLSEPDDDLTRYGHPRGPVVERIGLRRRRLRQSGELLLLPLTHQGRSGLRAFGAFAMHHAAPDRARVSQSLIATGTRIIEANPAQAAGGALLSAVAAEHVISRHGHLTLMRGLRDA